MGKIFALATALTLSLAAHANAPSQSDLANYRATSDQIVRALNTLYPELSVEVIRPAQENVLIDELDALKSSLAGEEVPDGALYHLACCKPSCGGDKGCK